MVIHQIWFQSMHIPEKYIPMKESWFSNNPDYKQVMWDGATIRDLILNEYPEYLRMWDEYPNMIQKIDSGKIFILHHYGGVYIDLDIVSIKPIDSLFKDYDIVFSQCFLHTPTVKIMSMLNLKRMAKTHINNAFIACIPQHPVMSKMIRMLPKSRGFDCIHSQVFHGVYVARTAGPELLSEALYRVLKKGLIAQKSVLVLKPQYVEPQLHFLTKAPIVTKKTIAIHHTERLWMKQSLRAKMQMTVGIAVLVLFLLYGMVKIKSKICVEKRKN